MPGDRRALRQREWIGNVIPLAPDQKKRRSPARLPCNVPGLTCCRAERPPAIGPTSSSIRRWPGSRRERQHADGDNVKVPWKRYSCTTTPLLSRDIYVKSPSHCFGTISPCALRSKMRLLLVCAAVSANPPAPIRCRRCARSSARWRRSRRRLRSGSTARSTPAKLGRGLMSSFNRAPVCGAVIVYAEHSRFIDELRTLCGGRRGFQCRRMCRCWTIRSSPGNSTPIGRRRRRLSDVG